MRPPHRLLQTMWQHPWRNWGLLLYTATLTVCVRVGLSLYPLNRIIRALWRVAAELPQRLPATRRYRLRAAWAARAVGRRFLPERPCLTQALVLQYLLLRRGDDEAELHIGVAKNEDGLHAHAWVERNGQVLIGGADSPQEYERFDDLARKVRSTASADRPDSTSVSGSSRP
ncbi:hypothetical protein GGP90_000831 [Salinibacter ruber]|nr:hypothetical protein [Salinibacter ruber]MCS3756068.1 hypothetical protein [Salinibacter ruber]